MTPSTYLPQTTEPRYQYPVTLGRLALNQPQNGTFHNFTDAGQRLQTTADDMVDLIGLEMLDASWKDEGARMFAEALALWSDGEIQMAAVTSDGHSPTHVAGYLAPDAHTDSPGMLIDAAGLEWANSLRGRLQTLGRPQDGHIVLGDDAQEMVADLQHSPDISATAARTLDLALGSFADWKHDLMGEVNMPVAFQSEQWQRDLPLLDDRRSFYLSSYAPINGDIQQGTSMGSALQAAAHSAKSKIGETFPDRALTRVQAKLQSQAFTAALAYWSKGRIEPVAVSSKERITDYIVGRLALGAEGDATAILIDDEGPTTPTVLSGRLAFYDIHEPSLISGLRGKEIASLMPHQDAATRIIIDTLNAELGSFESWEARALNDLAGPVLRSIEPEQESPTPSQAPGM